MTLDWPDIIWPLFAVAVLVGNVAWAIGFKHGSEWQSKFTKRAWAREDQWRAINAQLLKRIHEMGRDDADWWKDDEQ